MTDRAALYESETPKRPEIRTAAGQLALKRAGASLAAIAGGAYGLAAVLTYSPNDPSLNVATSAPPTNLLGAPGAVFADLAVQTLGAAAPAALAALLIAGVLRVTGKRFASPVSPLRVLAAALGVTLLGALASLFPTPGAWPLGAGLGGLMGDAIGGAVRALAQASGVPGPSVAAGILLFAGAVATLGYGFRVRREAALAAAAGALAAGRSAIDRVLHRDEAAGYEPERDLSQDRGVLAAQTFPRLRAEPSPAASRAEARAPAAQARPATASGPAVRVNANVQARVPQPSQAAPRPRQGAAQQELPFFDSRRFELPGLDLLSPAKPRTIAADGQALQAQAKMLAEVLAEYGVQGDIVAARPGPVVTLFELEPTPGVRSSRVIGLADDIARSMSATAARVSVIPGRNAIGIELPNAKRETVYLRTLLASNAFVGTQGALPLALGETIEGEPYAADLGKMPHLLIAGTTGSGKSVGINAMILSLLFRLTPEQCRFIMIDPKMLELSVYEGIPHLLAPVVTDPKKAVVALKWTVREMEERYRRMSKLGVRNIQGYNERVQDAIAAGERLERQVQTGFDPDTGEPVFETRELPLETMPYIVVVIDEMADLMITAGKEIEPLLQRIAQMARAAGIHLLMATQRPSVDVITGTIKANFPTRISYSVTTKIDSRTILGEQGAEQLLGMGDLLYMASGGRIRRLHGPFVSDAEVERVVALLKAQGTPQYRAEVLEDPETAVNDDEDDDLDTAESSGDDLFDRAVAIVRRDRKASTSYLQRRLQVGYNKAATLIERMEEEGIVSPPNHAGKREILTPGIAAE